MDWMPPSSPPKGISTGQTSTTLSVPSTPEKFRNENAMSVDSDKQGPVAKHQSPASSPPSSGSSSLALQGWTPPLPSALIELPDTPALEIHAATTRTRSQAWMHHLLQLLQIHPICHLHTLLGLRHGCHNWQQQQLLHWFTHCPKAANHVHGPHPRHQPQWPHGFRPFPCKFHMLELKQHCHHPWHPVSPLQGRLHQLLRLYLDRSHNSGDICAWMMVSQYYFKIYVYLTIIQWNILKCWTGLMHWVSMQIHLRVICFHVSLSRASSMVLAHLVLSSGTCKVSCYKHPS